MQILTCINNHTLDNITANLKDINRPTTKVTH